MSATSPKQKKINSVLFDLDGTLLDSAPDLAATLNALLLAQQLPALPYATIRPSISEGVAGLLKLGFNINEKDSRFPHLRKQFIDHYSQNSCKHTQLFPGIETLLDYLEKKQIAWGIVTNKSMALTLPLINHFALLKKAKCIVAGDTLEHSKPHPQPLLHACQCLGSLPRHCVYIGDAKRDIDAAKAAGMQSILALYGYIHSTVDVATWHADTSVHSTHSLLDYLRSRI